MSGKEFANLSLSFTQRGERDYEITATLDDGPPTTSTFALPLSDAELEATIRTLSATRSMLAEAQLADSADVGDGGDPAGATEDGDAGDPADRADAPTRTITPVASYSRSARDFGVALANALLDGEVGAMFDEARESGGVRLCLNMTDEPELLRIPWEYLRRDGRDLALRSDSTVVRELDTAERARPQAVEGQIQMLGVIANPLGDLDVEGERQRIGDAVARSGDKIALRWLEDCSYRALKRELESAQDAGRPFHILHFVGHSAFTPDGNSVVLLCDDEGNKAEVEANSIAQLLGKHDSLQLVVFNSCDGARTTLEDPFEGVATMLVQQGKSAVIAMQFEITDKAAKAFAEELYYQLVARRLPIDAAVAEARAALQGVSPVEFATPVLFLRPGHLRLFHFVDAEPEPVADPDPSPPAASAPAAAAPATPPPAAVAAPLAPPPVTAASAGSIAGLASVPPPAAPPPGAPGAPQEGWSRRTRRLVVAAGVLVGVFIVLAIIGAFLPDEDDDGGSAIDPLAAELGTVEQCVFGDLFGASFLVTDDPEPFYSGLDTCDSALLELEQAGLGQTELAGVISSRWDETVGVLTDYENGELTPEADQAYQDAGWALFEEAQPLWFELIDG